MQFSTNFAPSSFAPTAPVVAPDRNFRLPGFARFGRGGVNYRSKEPISLDQLAQIVPSVFAESAHSSRSDKYTYIPTREVLGGLVKEGFQIFSVMQGGSRDDDKRGFTKHLLRLRHESTAESLATALAGKTGWLGKDGPSYPEIVLFNSHDGTCSWRMMGGIFRMICGNGMIVSDATFSDVRIPHKGDVRQNVIDGCIEVVQAMPRIGEQIEAFRALSLSGGERMAMATAALEARYGRDDEGKDLSPVTPEQVLGTRRREDQDGSLWSTLNVLQENLIKGGVHYLHRDGKGKKSRRQTRTVNGVDGSTNVNRAVWRLAEEMAKLKANG